MKRLLSITLLTILFGCSEDGKESKDYDSLAGTWVFSDENISGTVEFIKVTDEIYGTVEGTKFKINGIEYMNNISSTMELYFGDGGLEMDGFYLSNNYDYDIHVYISGGNYNASFTEMRFSGYYWNINCESDCPTGWGEAITLTRGEK